MCESQNYHTATTLSVTFTYLPYLSVCQGK